MNRIDDDDDDTQVYQTQSFKKHLTHIPQYEMGWNAALDEAAARAAALDAARAAALDAARAAQEADLRQMIKETK